MAEQTRSEKRQRRSAAREQRRSFAAKPFEELDEAAGAEESEGPGRETLKHVAATAALGAVVAGVAGAAKALAERRGEQPASNSDADTSANEAEDDVSEGSAREQAAGADVDRGEAQPEAQDDEPTVADDEQPQAAAEQDDEQASGDDEQPQAAAEPDETEARSQADDSGEQDEQPQDADEAELHGQREPGEEETESSQNEPDEAPNEGADGSGPPAQRGASTEDVKKIVEEAKRELQELLGYEPERVSGFDRSEGRWTVTLEVVEVHRVPETTDVMSSYEIAFDDDRNLVSVSELRRYRRSQVEER